MRILAIGDPEGKIRYNEVKLLAERYLKEGDYIIFLGDYFSSPYTEYFRYLKGIAFPERSIFKDLNKKYKIILVYGNKDVKSSVFNLDKKKKDYNIFSIEDYFGELEIDNFKFVFINGSNLVNFTGRIGAKISREIDNLKKKYNKVRLVDLPSEAHEYLEKKYGTFYRIFVKYTYATSFSFLENYKNKKYDFLLTHTPPFLEGAELISGEYPDIAIYKEDGFGGIQPASPRDKDAKRSHVGHKKIREFIENNKVKIIICGHIHEGSGIAIYKNTLVLNPGSKAVYFMKNKVLPYIVLEFDEDLKNIRYIHRDIFNLKEGEINL